MVDPDVIIQLHIPSREITSTTLSTTTVQGTSAAETCQVIKNLRITSLHDGVTRTLPPTYVCYSLPDASHEVASKKDVAKIPGLRHLAQLFHDKKDELPTIILIGRDCVWAQQQEQTMPTHETDPIATKTPLGYALIGPKTNHANKTTVKDKPIQDNSTREHETAVVNQKTSTTPFQHDVTDEMAERYVKQIMEEAEYEQTHFLASKALLFSAA